MYGHPTETGQDTQVVDAGPATLRMAGDQRVFAGPGAVHPMQPARDTQPGLIKPGHLRADDAVTDQVGESVQPGGGPRGQRCYCPIRDRGTEQFSQGLGGAVFGQELAHVQVDHNCGDPRPVLYWGVHPLRCRGAGAVPAHTFPFHQLVFGHLNRYRQQIEHLPPFDPGHRPSGKTTPTTVARPRLMHPLVGQASHLLQRFTPMTRLPTRLTASLTTQ